MLVVLVAQITLGPPFPILLTVLTADGEKEGKEKEERGLLLKSLLFFLATQ
jgi:hypothetical protein